MVRPRFHALPDERRTAILDAAFVEFAAHGFAAASLNRIIDAAAISKGSMYYYFDGKDDLYAHVIRTYLEQMIIRSGPFPVPPATDREAFWTTIEDHCRRLARALAASPQLANLLRDWLSAAGTPTMEAARRDAEREASPWLARALAAGQSGGAVRTDVPDDLLMAVVGALGHLMDLWLITRPNDPVGHDDPVHVFVDLMRRALAP
ncbi:TetR/AcrR family transcriptional regulator [Agromyces sp. Marseille-P2726]|uniref:TetR/AcrR family transcriptional regulator n=1 Tax=Agromyces sp. Marseille-P2726 TaxID=2709132 RepID=UPI00156F68E5|nr:TetR/AcrR family transcriptional regulator [Agromyces sp. Marseille-P2726]